MAGLAALLTDSVLPHLPVRQWVLSLPKRLRPYLHHNADVAGAYSSPTRLSSPPSSSISTSPTALLPSLPLGTATSRHLPRSDARLRPRGRQARARLPFDQSRPPGCDDCHPAYPTVHSAIPMTPLVIPSSQTPALFRLPIELAVTPNDLRLRVANCGRHAVTPGQA